MKGALDVVLSFLFLILVCISALFHVIILLVLLS